VSRVLRPAQNITGHFRDESFQAITCTGTDNTKQTGENTPKTQQTGPGLGKLTHNLHTEYPSLNLNH